MAFRQKEQNIIWCNLKINKRNNLSSIQKVVIVVTSESRILARVIIYFIIFDAILRLEM